MTEREYFPGYDATPAEIEAFDRGELVAWRRGIDGVMWYKRVTPDPHTSFGEIRAVPPAAEAATDCDDQ